MESGFQEGVGEKMSDQEAYEYHCVDLRLGNDVRIEKLNELAATGWELVCVDALWGYFRRPCWVGPVLKEHGEE